MRHRLVTALVIFLFQLTGIARGQTERPSQAVLPRKAWVYEASGKRGSFVKGSGKQWTENTVEGDKIPFEERGVTDAYIEMFDGGRNMRVRLYADRAEWQQNENPAWNRLYAGHWVDIRALPAVPARDYRIRVAYFLANDRAPAPDYEKRIRVLLHFVAEVYRQDFQARRIRSKGLRFETRDGQPVVHLIHGAHNAAFYTNAPDYEHGDQWGRILPEIPKSLGVPTQHLIILFAETYDTGPAKHEFPGGIALGARFSSEGGVGMFSAWVLRPEFCATTVPQQKKLLFDPTPIFGRSAVGHGGPNSPRFQFIEDGFGAVAHELGHALGLPHDHRQDGIYIMGNGFRNLRWNFTTPPDQRRRARFSDDNARILYASRYLAPDAVLDDSLPPTVQLSLAAPLKHSATRVKVSVTASDNEGLRAILFYAPAQDSVIAGRALKGKQQQFQQTLTVEPLKAGPFRLEAVVADAGGNLTHAEVKGSVE